MTDRKEWRAYHFGNFYLSSIQQGIQAAHAQTSLFVKYLGMRPNLKDRKVKMFLEWADNPTMICLNGGNNEQMHFTKDFFSSKDNPYPWCIFCEDEESLGGLLTNVVILLPKKIWNAFDTFRTVIYQTDNCKTFEEYYEAVSVAEYYDEMTMNHRALRIYEKEYGPFSLYESRIVDYMRRFRLAV